MPGFPYDPASGATRPRRSRRRRKGLIEKRQQPGAPTRKKNGFLRPGETIVGFADDYGPTFVRTSQGRIVDMATGKSVSAPRTGRAKRISNPNAPPAYAGQRPPQAPATPARSRPPARVDITPPDTAPVRPPVTPPPSTPSVPAGVTPPPARTTPTDVPGSIPHPSPRTVNPAGASDPYAGLGSIPHPNPRAVPPAVPPRTTTSTAGASGPSGPQGLKPLSLSDIKPGMTTAQILAMAKQMAEASLAPYREELIRQQNQARTDAEGRAKLVSGLYAQLGALQQNISPAVSAAYSGAAKDVSNLAQGYGGALQGAQQASSQAANQNLAAVGNPTLPGPTGDARQAFQALEGAIPSSNLSTKGAAFASAAAFMPGATAQLGLNDSLMIMNNYETQRKRYADDLKALALRAPELVNTYMDQLYTRSMNEQQLAINKRTAEWNSANQLQQQKITNWQWKKDYLLRLRGVGINEKIALANAKNDKIEAENDYQVEMAKLARDNREWFIETFGVDPTTGTPTVEMRRFFQNQAEFLAKEAKDKKSGGLSPAEVRARAAAKQEARKDAGNAVLILARPEVDRDGNVITPAHTYQEALLKLMTIYGDTLGLQGVLNILHMVWTRPGYEIGYDDNGRKIWVQTRNEFNGLLGKDINKDGVIDGGRPLLPSQVRDPVADVNSAFADPLPSLRRK